MSRLLQISIFTLAAATLVAAQAVNPVGASSADAAALASRSARSAAIPQFRSGPSVATEGLSTMKLATGSMIDVRVFEEPDIDGSYRIDAQGNISVPLAGDIHIESMTLREAESAISDKLVAEEILKAPHVVVNVDEFGAQNIVVLGEVNAPGRYPALEPRKLIDVLAQAGGQTTVAGNEVIVHRAGKPDDVTETIHYKRSVNDQVALNTLIGPGDSVLVKRAGIVYVLGSVLRPGGYLMQESGDLDVGQAIALALGTTPEAAVTRVRVLRKNPDGSVSEIEGKYSKFADGKAFPLALQAEDVVFVPNNKLKSAFLTGRQVLGSAASATIYTLR
ncbi:MAG TPA: polysaccharide biosynthesis/export family protein [Candidatus Koribacter sp.]|jgi:polysaccharide export outer membrane protein